MGAKEFPIEHALSNQTNNSQAQTMFSTRPLIDLESVQFFIPSSQNFHWNIHILMQFCCRYSILFHICMHNWIGRIEGDGIHVTGTMKENVRKMCITCSLVSTSKGKCTDSWRPPNVDIMTSELLSADYQLDFRGPNRPIRPKLLKLTDDGKCRKKNKFKVLIIFIHRIYYFAVESNRIDRATAREFRHRYQCVSTDNVESVQGCAV